MIDFPISGYWPIFCDESGLSPFLFGFNMRNDEVAPFCGLVEREACLERRIVVGLCNCHEVGSKYGDGLRAALS
jgi:hypothetical protein